MSKFNFERDIFGEFKQGFGDARKLQEGSTEEAKFSELFAKEFLAILTEIKAKQFIRNGKLKYRLVLAGPYKKALNEKDTLFLKKTVESVLDPNPELVKATGINGTIYGTHDNMQAGLLEFEMKSINPQRNKVIVKLRHAFGEMVTDFIIDNQTGKVVKQSRNRISRVMRERGFYRWSTVRKKIAEACRAKKKAVTIR